MTNLKSIQRRFLILAISLVFLTSGVGTVPAAEKLKWHPYTKGMLLGQTLHKKVIINFYADWCQFCEKMDQETFADQKISDYMTHHFIAIKVDSDAETEIASHYKVAGLPSTRFVAENGEEISQLQGYIPPDTFLSILRYIQTDSYQKMSFDAFLKSL